MHPDDERLAQLLRLLRRRLNLSQRELARLSRVPRGDILRIEAAAGGSVRIDRVRRVIETVGGRARLAVWWNGAAADRLLDQRHARVLERAIAVIRSRTFVTASEVTFSEFGERGSIDLLAGQAASRCALVGEVKSALGSLEETNRMLDVKERLAPKLVKATFGWTPQSVSRVLILPDDRTIRRVVDEHAATMAAVYPARSREFRAWLRQPSGRISAIWFLSEVPNRDRITG